MSPVNGNEAQAQAAAQKLKDQELVQFKLSMDALKKRLSDPKAKEKQLKGACRNFEAVFLGKLWEQMRATVPKEGYLHGPQEDMYLSMFDQAFSEKMADSGGIGLADMLYGHLEERLKDMGRNALPGRMGAPQAPAAPVKSLAESGRDSRQEPAAAAEPVHQRDLKPLKRPGQPIPIGPRRQQSVAAPASAAGQAPAAGQAAAAGPSSAAVSPAATQAPAQAPVQFQGSYRTPSMFRQPGPARSAVPGPASQAVPAAQQPVSVAETPEQVAAQLEALIRHIETSEPNPAGQPAQAAQPGSVEQSAAEIPGGNQVQPAAVTPPPGLRTYQGMRQSGTQRSGRKIAKVG